LIKAQGTCICIFQLPFTYVHMHQARTTASVE